MSEMRAGDLREPASPHAGLTVRRHVDFRRQASALCRG